MIFNSWLLSQLWRKWRLESDSVFIVESFFKGWPSWQVMSLKWTNLDNIQFFVSRGCWNIRLIMFDRRKVQLPRLHQERAQRDCSVICVGNCMPRSIQQLPTKKTTPRKNARQKRYVIRKWCVFNVLVVVRKKWECSYSYSKDLQQQIIFEILGCWMQIYL